MKNLINILPTLSTPYNGNGRGVQLGNITSSEI